MINRRDKKATAMAPIITTTNNKGKTRQMSVPVTYIGDKKEHNERMQAIIFAESNEEWLPIPEIDKEKYAVGEEQPTAGKGKWILFIKLRAEKKILFFVMDHKNIFFTYFNFFFFNVKYYNLNWNIS